MVWSWCQMSIEDDWAGRQMLLWVVMSLCEQWCEVWVVMGNRVDPWWWEDIWANGNGRRGISGMHISSAGMLNLPINSSPLHRPLYALPSMSVRNEANTSNVTGTHPVYLTPNNWGDITWFNNCSHPSSQIDGAGLYPQPLKVSLGLSLALDWTWCVVVADYGTNAQSQYQWRPQRVSLWWSPLGLHDQGFWSLVKLWQWWMEGSSLEPAVQDGSLWLGGRRQAASSSHSSCLPWDGHEFEDLAKGSPDPGTGEEMTMWLMNNH